MPHTRTVWTPEQDQYVRDMASTTPLDVLADDLGKTYSAVKNRVFVLGVKARPPAGRKRAEATRRMSHRPDLLPRRCAKRGITVEQFCDFWRAQAGRCAICSSWDGAEDPLLSTMSIDHNHETGKVRGLLCRYCNVGLGQFREDVSALARAILYLEETS